MENNDGKRSIVGVAVTLVDLGNGETRVVFDDVRAGEPKRETT